MIFCLNIIIKSCVSVREPHLAGSLAMDPAVSLGRSRILADLGGVREGCAALSKSARCSILVCINNVLHHQTDLLLTPTNPPQSPPSVPPPKAVRNVRTDRARVDLGVTRHIVRERRSCQ
jgi:hypothetical protein